MNNKFTELMVREPVTLTAEQRSFVETHNQIIMCGNLAMSSITRLAKELKKMRDGKLYKSAGFGNFEEYVENAVGIGRTQAYTYIRVIENLDEKYISENSELGLTKLALLAIVPEEKREELSESVDIKIATSKQLEKAIRERDEAKRKAEDFRTEAEASNTARDELQQAYDSKKRELLEVKSKVDELTKARAALEKSLKEVQAKSKPEIKTVKDEAAEKEAQAQRERADRLERELKAKDDELNAARERKKIIASNSLLTFKIKFEDVQRMWADLKELVKGMEGEYAEKCNKAMTAVLDTWNNQK